MLSLTLSQLIYSFPSVTVSSSSLIKIDLQIPTYFCLFKCLSLGLIICLSLTCSLVHLFIYLYVHQYVCLSFCLSVWVYLCLFCLPVELSVSVSLSACIHYLLQLTVFNSWFSLQNKLSAMSTVKIDGSISFTLCLLLCLCTLTTYLSTFWHYLPTYTIVYPLVICLQIFPPRWFLWELHFFKHGKNILLVSVLQLPTTVFFKFQLL